MDENRENGANEQNSDVEDMDNVNDYNNENRQDYDNSLTEKEHYSFWKGVLYAFIGFIITNAIVIYIIATMGGVPLINNVFPFTFVPLVVLWIPIMIAAGSMTKKGRLTGAKWMVFASIFVSILVLIGGCYGIFAGLRI